MNLTGPLIEEDFVVAGNTLTRMLSVDGATGFSQVVLDEQPPVDSPRTDLLSIWDKSFLAGLVEYPANRDSRDAIRIADVFCGAGGCPTAFAKPCGLVGSAPKVFSLPIWTLSRWTYIGEILIPLAIRFRTYGIRLRRTTPHGANEPGS